MRAHHLAVARTARVWTLGDEASAPEAWIVLHGHGQLAADFLRAFEPVAGGDRLVVAPEALNRYYLTERAGEGAARPVGATWMTREDREAEIADYVAYLDAVARRYAAGRAVTILGFSQGVATAMRWAARGTTRAARLIAWAGQLPPDVDLRAHRDALPAGGLDFVLGRDDTYAAWIDEPAMARRLAEAGWPLRVHRFDGGHRLDRATLLALVAG